MPLTYSLDFDCGMLLEANQQKGSAGWEYNRNVARFLCQGNAADVKVNELVHLVISKPAQFAKCIDDQMLADYKRISASIADDLNPKYLGIIAKFRANLAALDPQYAAMVDPKVVDLEIDAADIAILREAVDAVIKFSADGRNKGREFSAQQLEDAKRSVELVERAVDAGIDLAENEHLFMTKGKSKLQSAINHFQRTNNTTMVAAMQALNCPYTPSVVGGVKRNPNSRNIDYVFLICLVYKEMLRKDPAFDDSKSAVFIQLLEGMGKQSLPVSFTGCAAAEIPENARPTDIPPGALTKNRLEKAMRIINTKMDTPEDVIKVGCRIDTVLAIAHIIVELKGYPDNTSAMYEYSRYLRSSLLDKIGCECVNFMDKDPFLIEIHEKGKKPKVETPKAGEKPKVPVEDLSEAELMALLASKKGSKIPIGRPLAKGVFDANTLSPSIVVAQKQKGFTTIAQVDKTDPQWFIKVSAIPADMQFVMYDKRLIQFISKTDRNKGMTFCTAAEQNAFNDGYQTDA